MKVTKIEPIRRVVFMLRYNKASLVDVATGKEKAFSSVDQAFDAKRDYESGKVDFLC